MSNGSNAHVHWHKYTQFKFNMLLWKINDLLIKCWNNKLQIIIYMKPIICFQFICNVGILFARYRMHIEMNKKRSVCLLFWRVRTITKLHDLHDKHLLYVVIVQTPAYHVLTRSTLQGQQQTCDVYCCRIFTNNYNVTRTRGTWHSWHDCQLSFKQICTYVERSRGLLLFYNMPRSIQEVIFVVYWCDSKIDFIVYISRILIVTSYTGILKVYEVL